jgi:hypothetical protein
MNCFRQSIGDSIGNSVSKAEMPTVNPFLNLSISKFETIVSTC